MKYDWSNYLEWSCSCNLFIKARGLEDYITEVKSHKPAVGDTNACQWELENSSVMSWLIKSMQPSIAKGYLLLEKSEMLHPKLSLKFGTMHKSMR